LSSLASGALQRAERRSDLGAEAAVATPISDERTAVVA
jgi:hypothetical protein